MKARWREVAAGYYEDDWSFLIYAIAPPDASPVYSVRVYPRGGVSHDCPDAPLYLTLGAALAAVPTHVAEAIKTA